MDTGNKITYWFEIALDDLDSAGIMLEKNKYLQTGFYCHQALEKSLKGYHWFVNSEEPPYTHNLFKLCMDVRLYDSLNETQKNLIDTLMPLNIEARYPDDKMEILKTLGKSRIEAIYKQTGDLVRWIQSLTIR